MTQPQHPRLRHLYKRVRLSRLLTCWEWITAARKHLLPGSFLGLLLCLQPAWAEGKPQRIVSLNLCTDQLLLELVEPSRIASLTYLVAEPHNSVYAPQAEGIHLNHGLAEEIIPLQPDLILAGAFAAHSAVTLLKKLQFPVVIVDLPYSMEQTYQHIRDVAQQVGEPERGEQLIQTMQQRLANVQDDTRNQPRQRALLYSPNGYTAGSGTLKHDAIELAGLINVAAEQGITGYGTLSIEELLFTQPQQLLINDPGTAPHSLAHQYIQHPALSRHFGDARITRIPSRLWSCAGPQVVTAVEQLAGLHHSPGLAQNQRAKPQLPGSQP